ncbi:MBL fold metallo-hydrolase [Sphingomonas sp. AP4-R1]|uniref:MBL fold metallo-hydrolase n=1 Tax=Sphingomonas sp. AP4-R1 TaxID=2735134 RepID=UPI0014932E4F|nr:MBL fold metallo-hydrolase [Sphingomonas sp. AP4-R1]QJU58308.1 MBL fold metallo-hydrolase [Sphingomonas sp. AP4-R1]
MEWGGSSIAVAAAVASLVSAHAGAQFEPLTVQKGPKLEAVTAFPPPGTYANTTGIALGAAPGAAIHYTWDGSKPTEQSARIVPGQQLFVAGVYEGQRGVTSGYTIRAVATKDGFTDSDPATFSYTVERRDRTTYISEDVADGVRMIRDSDNDKMFLIRGTKAYALIDTGMGQGALRDYVARFTGGLPVIVIFTHSHGDHIGQGGQFVADSTEYVGAGDRAAVAQFLARQGAEPAMIEAHLKVVGDGARVDLGDRALEIYEVPGHTPGSIAIFDPASGNLFTGDTFGNNSPLPPDVMWMQGYRQSLDIYLANVRTVRAKLAGRVKRIFTGHNDRPLEGTVFLDNLQRAIQRGLDEGDQALIPSWRPAGIVQLVQGDRRADPNWFGVNVNRETYLPAAPDQIAGLTGLAISGGVLSRRFDPTIRDYVVTRLGRSAVTIAAIPTSSRSQALRIDGRAARSGMPVRIVSGHNDVVIEVVAPDGKTRARYGLKIENGRPGG